MINHGKKNLLGVLIDATDYESAVATVISAAVEGKRLTVAALAVHGVMTGALDPEHKFRLNHLDLVVPDGQPVRWAINTLHGCRLKDRVYGPKLTQLLCLAAAQAGLSVFFYGSTQAVVHQLASRLTKLCPGLIVAGYKHSVFRPLSPEERNVLVAEIQASGATILFVGLGCPRQEVFAYEMGLQLKIPIISVGAAFDYYAGILREPPLRIQRAGLQWLYRLIQEPRRLWRRYLILNTLFVVLFSLQVLRLWRPRPTSSIPARELRYG